MVGGGGGAVLIACVAERSADDGCDAHPCKGTQPLSGEKPRFCAATRPACSATRTAPVWEEPAVTLRRRVVAGGVKASGHQLIVMTVKVALQPRQRSGSPPHPALWV